MIYNLQVLRFLSAIGIAVFHFSIHIHTIYKEYPYIHYLEAGVDVFFVISGFVMYKTTEQKNTKYILTFIKKRLSKVYFNYLLAVFISLPILLIATPWVRDCFKSYSGFQLLLKNIFLIPQNGPLILLQSWSLSFEIFFYLIFSSVLLFSSKLRPILILIVLILFSYFSGGFFRSESFLEKANILQSAIHILGNNVILEFSSGVFISYLYSINFHKSILFLMMSVFLIILGVIFINEYDMSFRLLYFGCLASGIVMFSVYLEGQGIVACKKASLLLGELSFTIYLVHIAAMHTGFKVLNYIIGYQSNNQPIIMLIFASIMIIPFVFVFEIMKQKIHISYISRLILRKQTEY